MLKQKVLVFSCWNKIFYFWFYEFHRSIHSFHYILKRLHCWDPIAKKKDFLYPRQHCVAHASLNFYTYIVYWTLKHVRNLLSIFFFLEESGTLSLAFPIPSCHTDMNITLFFVTKVLTCSVTSHSVVQSTQWNVKFVFNEWVLCKKQHFKQSFWRHLF